MPRETLSTRITISIDPEQYAAVEELATQEERSCAWIIRKAVQEYLNKKSSNGHSLQDNSV
jgi:predicted transcriptional regulator